jgi:hypothetical protein
MRRRAFLTLALAGAAIAGTGDLGGRGSTASATTAAAAAVAAAAAAAASAAAAAVAASAPAGLYALSPLTQLLFINASGAALPIGSPLSDYAAGPALSAVDGRAGVMYAILLKATSPVAAAPFLVGIRLSDGAVASSISLPFANDGATTMGHLALNVGATPTVAIVGGVNAAGEHEFGTVTAASGGDYKQFARLSASLNDVGGCSTAFVPATNELLVQFNANRSSPSSSFGGRAGGFEVSVYSVSLANGTVRVLTESLAQGRDVQTLGGYDAATGLVHALGFDASTGARELVDLDPVLLSLRIVGRNVSVDSVALNGMSAFDAARRSLWWVGDRGGSDEFFLIETSVAAGGAELSRAALCAYGDCPMSISWYAGGASLVEGVAAATVVAGAGGGAREGGLVGTG